MTYTVRTETEANYARVAELVSLGYPELVDAKQVREWRRNAAGDGIQRHVVADAEDGRVAGYAHALHDAWDGVGSFWLHIAVDPKERRHRVGAQAAGVACRPGMGRGIHPPQQRFGECADARYEP